MSNTKTVEQWKEFHKKLYSYNNKQQACINFDEKTLSFLRFLKKEKYILSVSEGVRDLIHFAMPFFLTVSNNIDKILQHKVTDFSFIHPKIAIANKKKSKAKKISKAELKKKYPNMVYYKDMNEE